MTSVQETYGKRDANSCCGPDRGDQNGKASDHTGVVQVTVQREGHTSRTAPQAALKNNTVRQGLGDTYPGQRGEDSMAGKR